MQLFYPDHPSVLQPEMIANWKKSRGIYNFTSLPDVAILCAHYPAVKHLNTIRAKKIKGLNGKSFIKNGFLVCSNFDNGGPGVINLLEELRVHGVRQFIFIGLAGIISPRVSEAEAYVVNAALSGSSAAVYYSEQEVHIPYNKIYLDNTLPELERSVCFSTDAPYRETRPLLQQASEKGAELIEMECAAIYAFCNFYKLSSTCILVAADDLKESWQPPRNWNAVQTKMKEVIDQIALTLRR